MQWKDMPTIEADKWSGDVKAIIGINEQSWEPYGFRTQCHQCLPNG